MFLSMENTDNTLVVNVDETDSEEVEETLYLEHMRTKPWLFQKGVVQNPGGRPKGKTMKEWTREYLASLTDKERIEYLQGIPKVDLWRMAEGNPTEDRNIKVSIPTPILGGASAAITLEAVDNVGTQLDGDVPTT